MTLQNQQLENQQKAIDRWDILRGIYAGGSIGIGQRVIKQILEIRHRPYSQSDLQTMLQDLADRDFCKIKVDDDNLFHCKITPLGTDLIEYHISCPDAIARPPKTPTLLVNP